MYFRKNGKSYHRGCDINILMESQDGQERPSAEEIERRIQLYSLRYDYGRDIFSGEKLAGVETLAETEVE